MRGIHAYGKATKSARAGHSSALNVPDVDHKRVHRGHVVARPGFFSTVRMVGARLTVLPALDRPVTNRMSVRLHVGTADPLGEVVILDRDELPPGESGLVQLRLEEPLVCAPGDRFVLRLASPAVTLGGGVILEESRFRLKRFKDFVLSELQHQEESLSDPRTLVEAILARGGNQFAATADLAHAIKREVQETARLLAELEEQGSVRNLAPSGAVQPGRWMHVDRLEALLLTVSQAVQGWFEANPHRRVVEVIELRRRTKLDPQLLGALLDELARREQLVLESGGHVALAGRSVELDEEQRARRDAVLAALDAAAFQPPSPEELASSLGLSAADLARTLELLVDEGSAVQVQKDLYLAAGPMQRAREAIVANCERNRKLEIPELRDALGTTRKFLIPLLEYFDTAGLTLRQAGHRILKRT